MSKERSDFSEKHLLRLAAQGDKEAYGVLYERYLDEIYRYVTYRVGDPQEAEDITANVFVRTWERLPKMARRHRNSSSFRGWLYRVAKNLVVDFYRRREPMPLPDGLHKEDGLVEGIAAQHTKANQLVEAISLLQSDYQQIIILRFINQLSHKECANIMKRSVGATRVLQHRALERLREIIQNESTEAR